MPSTPRRKTVTSRLAAPLLGLLLPVACADEPAASDSASEGASETDATGTSAGDETTTAEQPTTGDPTGVPVDSEGRYFIRIDDEPVPPVVLEMDKAKVIEVFGDDALKQIDLLEVDTTALLTTVLDQIQNACGNKWRLDSVNPMHDCQNPQYIPYDGMTADQLKAKYGDFGKSFGPDWKTSPEFAMVRLLSMTPANVVVKGTSLQKTAEYIALNPALPFTFKKVLADSLGIFVTDAFIPTEQLMQALKDTLLSSHPNVDNDEARLPVTLYDAVYDMRPLAEKFGKVGDHPGILLADDETFTTKSDALTDEFRMKAIARSNLRLVEGIDASVGAGSMFISTAPAPLSFDFNDPEQVQLLGIAAMPTVDMRMSITELDTRIKSCVKTDACKGNYPDSPVGDEFIWSTAQWSLERIIGTAGFYTYGKRVYETCLIKDDPICDAGVWIGPNKIPYPPPAAPGPIGWTQFKVLDKQVPDAQFLWEMFLEIAQVAIHDPTGDDDYAAPTQTQKANNIAEGDAKPVYALRGVPIGLTAEDMIKEIRPKLQEQADFIANVILGKFWKHNDHLDFYYRRGEDGGAPMLFFIGPDDPRPSATDAGQLDKTYDYASPGFFADKDLTNKLSSTDLPGTDDSTHEKLQLAVGETTVYMQDDAGQTYRLRFFVPEGADPTEIVVHVRPV